MPRTQQAIVRAVMAGVLSLLVLVLLLTCFTSVGVGQVGVVTRLNHVNRHLDSGIYLKLPWPFEQVAKFDVKTQIDTVTAPAASSDLQDATAEVATNYHLDDARIDNLYRTVGVDYKERLIDPAIQDSIKASTSQFVITDLITKRPELAAAIKKSLTEKLAPRGIVVEAINIKDLTPSREYSQAVENKQVAQQQAEQAQFNLQKAQLDAQANQAQQSALTDQILEQQAIAKWDGHLPTYVGQGSVFNIPLNK